MGMISRFQVVCVALLLASLSATGAHILDLPLGNKLSISLYPNDVFRVEVVPPNTQYRVTDVVLVPQLDDAKHLKVACASNTQCKVSAASSTVDVAVNTDDNSVVLEYKVDGKTVTVTRVPLKTGADQAAEATTFFHDADRLYGIPQHAMDLTLKKTTTYQLYNLDVFHYKLDDPGGIYGSIPFMVAHSATRSSGLLFLNSAELNVRILADEECGSATVQGAEWKAEVGVVDLFLFPGPNPATLHRQHATITGHAQLPPLFSLGYHQCRWNYRSQDDCLDVDANFDKFNIPYDVLWLDIEHADSKKYFTWDLHNFPEPQKMIDDLASRGRKMVTIKDPHVKRESGYHVHDEATSQGYYVKTESGSDYEGHCWPGTSSWVDYYNKKARDWYATMFKHDRYKGSTPDLYTWIDMNEPSVFNSHQVTMDRNAVHQNEQGNKVAHRYLHNMYGYYHTMSVYQGHLLSSEGKAQVKRPFILTRSFFSGSQRFAAMWTGDNMAKWDHLEKSIPMLLSLSLANYPFVGADCGGFFFNPEAELMVRWMQAGIFYPFFRGHAHLETKRREPWLFGEDATRRIRSAIALRYSLLPYLYTVFFEAHNKGLTVIRPLYFEFPQDVSVFDEQNTYMFGPALLVSPVVKEQEAIHTINFPAGANWFDYFTGEKMARSGLVPIHVTMDSMPLYIRGGFIVPTKQRLRRSSAGMAQDPLTLFVALDTQGNSKGELYVDDADTLDYEKGQFVHRVFTYTQDTLTSQKATPEGALANLSQDYAFPNEVERIVFYGLRAMPKRIVALENNDQQASKIDASGSVQQVATAASRELTFSPYGEHGAVVVRQPRVKAAQAWSISLEF